MEARVPPGCRRPLLEAAEGEVTVVSARFRTPLAVPPPPGQLVPSALDHPLAAPGAVVARAPPTPTEGEATSSGPHGSRFSSSTPARGSSGAQQPQHILASLTRHWGHFQLRWRKMRSSGGRFRVTQPQQQQVDCPLAFVPPHGSLQHLQPFLGVVPVPLTGEDRGMLVGGPSYGGVRRGGGPWGATGSNPSSWWLCW